MSSTKEKEFSELNIDDKLKNLYSMMCMESENAKLRHQEVTGKFAELGTRIEVIEKKCLDVDERCSELSHTVEQLKSTVNDLQQSALHCDLLIQGVPEIEENDQELSSIIHQVINKVPFKPINGIASLHRVGKAKKQTEATKPRPVLLKLENEDDKKGLLKAKKTVSISCDQFNCRGSPLGTKNQLIYFDERVTKYTADLFFEARKLRERNVIQSAWVRNGILKVKRSKDSDVIRIVNSQQLKKLDESSKKRPLSLSPPNTNEVTPENGVQPLKQPAKKTNYETVNSRVTRATSR